MVWDSLILAPSRLRVRSLFMPHDRRAAPLLCTIPGGCQRLVVVEARLSQGLSSVWRLSVVHKLWAVMADFGQTDFVKPRGSHTTTQELQTCTFESPGASNTTQNPREDPQRGEKNEFCGGTGKKKREILGPTPTLRTPILRTPTFLHPPTPTQNTQKKPEQLISKNNN